MNEQILEMLELQDAMNKKVDPDWRTAGFEWPRAIWTEAAELLDHIGWKWWKKQEPNVAQCHLEVVDIWHFYISAAVQADRSEGYSQTIEEISEAFLLFSERPMLVKVGLLEMVENFAFDTLLSGKADPFKIAAIMYMLNMSFEDLYRQYIAKNVLNFFRQDNGYREGTYQKVWFGREDNEFLEELLQLSGPDNMTYRNFLYMELESIYKNVVAGLEPGTEEYNRQVLVQNNEGDPIGGDCPDNQPEQSTEAGDNG